MKTLFVQIVSTFVFVSTINGTEELSGEDRTTELHGIEAFFSFHEDGMDDFEFVENHPEEEEKVEQ